MNFAKLLVGVGLACSISAQAAMLNFQCITNTSTTNCATGATQLSVIVTGVSATQALFTFNNIGANASSITDVYWDDGTLLGIAAVNVNNTGLVSFSALATPSNLPGANNISPAFVTTAGFSVDSNSPHLSQNGVNPGESLGVLFNLQTGKTYTDLLAALDATHRDQPGDLRIGIHVQSFSNGGSESFINTPTAVPLPAAVWLLGSGLIGMVGFLRKK